MAPLTPDRLHDPIRQYLQPCPVTFVAGDSVGAAIDAVRGARAGEFPCFYVIDDERRLSGLVTSHVLLNSEPAALIGDVMRHDAVAIPDWATVLVAAEFFASQPFRSFPVVGPRGELIGQVEKETRLTFYTRYGWLTPWCLTGVAVVMWGAVVRGAWRRRGGGMTNDSRAERDILSRRAAPKG